MDISSAPVIDGSSIIAAQIGQYAVHPDCPDIRLAGFA